MCRSELADPALDGVARFYTEVLGWSPTPSDPAVGEAAGHAAWLPYFCVADCDAVAARAQSLGGRLVVDPYGGRGGRSAVLRDRQDALFGVSGPA